MAAISGQSIKNFYYIKINIQNMIEDLRRKMPYCFLIIIIIIIIALYIAFVVLLQLIIKPWPIPLTIVYLIIYHIVLFLLLWSLIQAFRRDPGRVPNQWGFTIDNRNKKYCLICHVFKPQRTHHCSACNRCVLNMDHHCPWINTCIGFYNRKAFILMLIYTTIGTLLNIVCFLGSIPGIYVKLKEASAILYIEIIGVVIAFVFNCIIFFAITSFLKFHLQLIFNNYTTLETLELKRQGKDPGQVPSPYDIGNYYNWAQVFGRNSLTWPFPIYLSNQGPSGDGVIWPKKQ